MTPVRKGAVLVAAAILMLGVLVGCSTGAGTRELVMGSSDSAAMKVMAQIYAGALRHAGAAVSTESTVGDDQDLLARMGRTDVDLFPAFTGALLSQLAPDLSPTSVDDVYSDVNRSLPQGVSVGDATPVVATPQLFVATSLASAAEVTDLGGCARLPAGLPIVAVDAPSESTLRGFADAGCRLGAVQRVADAKAALTRAATGTAVAVVTPLDVSGDTASGTAGRVQALSAPSSTTPSSATPSSTTPSTTAPSSTSTGPIAQVLVPVYRSAALTREQVKAINKVAGEITTADLATLAGRVESGEKPGQLASDWLAEHGI